MQRRRMAVMTHVPFDPRNPATWNVTLTTEQVAAIYQKTPNALRKLCQRHVFVPAPYRTRPYLWRRIHVEIDVFGRHTLTRAS